jgi:hypothetical protein
MRSESFRLGRPLQSLATNAFSAAFVISDLQDQDSCPRLDQTPRVFVLPSASVRRLMTSSREATLPGAAGIIGVPGRLQSVKAAGFVRSLRPTSSECAR